MPTASLEKPVVNATGSVSSHVRRFRMVALLLVVAVSITGLYVHRAWEQTARREAYLPDLEVMARRDAYNGPLLALLGGRQAQAGEYATAAAALQRAIAVGEGQSDVWKTWAAATAASGNPVEAVSILRLSRNTLRNPDDIAEIQGSIDRVQSLGSEARPPQIAQAISPDGLTPMISRRSQGSFLNGFAHWWGEQHPVQSGFATRERRAKERPDDASAQRLWGLALQQNRRLPPAEVALRRAVTLAPNDPDAHFALAEVLKQSGSFSKAGLEYEACLRLRRDWLPALLGLGEVALNKSLIALSVSVFQKATAVAPKSADAWIGMGRAYYSTHIQLGQAVSAFQEGVRLAPTRTDFFPDYFRALRLTFHYDQAEAIIRQRLRVAPDEAQSHFLLALLLRDYQPTAARIAAAEQELRTSLRLTPHAEATEVELAQLLLQRGQPEEAVALLNDALDHNELNVKAIRMLERAYRQAGNSDLADKFQKDASGHLRLAQQLKELEDQEHRNPGDPKVHAQLATLYAQVGRHAEAEQEQMFAVYLHASPQAAKHAIKALDAATSISHPITAP